MRVTRGPGKVELLGQVELVAYHRVIIDGLFLCRSESVAFAYFGVHKFRADNAVLVAVKKDKRATRPASRFEVRVVHQHFKFGSHKCDCSAERAQVRLQGGLAPQDYSEKCNRLDTSSINFSK